MKFLIVLCFFITNAVLAGQGAGNGGFAVMVKDKYYTYDLYEASLHESTDITTHEDQLGATQLALYSIPNLNEHTAQYFSFKIHQLAQRSVGLALRSLDILSKYDWKIAPIELIPVNDIGRTPIPIENLVLKRAVYRDDKTKTIWIDNQIWKSLSNKNQSALIIHEIAYVMAVTTSNDLTSENVRKAVSLLYMPSFLNLNQTHVRQKLKTYLSLPLLPEQTRGKSCEEVFADGINLYGKIDEAFNNIYRRDYYSGSGWFNQKLNEYFSNHTIVKFELLPSGDFSQFIKQYYLTSNQATELQKIFNELNNAYVLIDYNSGTLGSGKPMLDSLLSQIITLFKEDPAEICIPKNEKKQFYFFMGMMKPGLIEDQLYTRLPAKK